MQSKQLHHDGIRTYALVFDSGDEVLAGLRQFAKEKDLDAAEITGLGAFSSGVLGFFDFERKDYDRIPVDEQVEVLSLTGNVSKHEGKPKVHVHMVLGRRDGAPWAGTSWRATPTRPSRSSS